MKKYYAKNLNLLSMKTHLACILMLIFACSSNAQITNKNSIWGEAQTLVVIEEVTHPFKLQKLQQSYEILPTSNAFGMETAEFVLVNYLNAMRMANYDQALQGWDTISQKQIKLQEQKTAVTIDQRLETWRKLFANNKIMLTARIQYSNYILIEYQIQSPSGKFMTEETVVLKFIDGKYLLTLEMADSAVAQGWKKPGSRIQRLVKHAYQTVN